MRGAAVKQQHRSLAAASGIVSERATAREREGGCEGGSEGVRVGGLERGRWGGGLDGERGRENKKGNSNQGTSTRTNRKKREWAGRRGERWDRRIGVGRLSLKLEIWVSKSFLRLFIVRGDNRER